MSSNVTLPLWLFLLLAVLALLALAHYLFVPGLRWLVRCRVNAVIEDVNQTLRVKLPTFQLSSREVLVDRLIHDRQVMDVVESEAARRGVARYALMTDVERYAREMVPAFNAYFYFRLGYWLARTFLRALYTVRTGFAHRAALAPVADNTTVVFFINHRSNMDYLLVTYLASRSAALSYGAGEWCRVWPFRSVMRLAGAYILRRNTDDPVYRKVLQRYVQIATESGVPHAIFGQGQLSRDGMVGPPKLGLLGYIAKTFDPGGDYDILFIPVATNFDRVVEERTLLANVDTDFRGRGSAFVLASTGGFLLKQIWRKLTGNWPGFGSACANFGEPVSLKAWSKENGIDFSCLDRQGLFEAVQRLGWDLTERVVRVMPVLPVPAIATALLETDAPLDRTALIRRTRDLLAEMRRAGAHVVADEAGEAAAIEDGLVLLTRRGLIAERDDQSLAAVPDERPLLQYHANSIGQLRSLINGGSPAQ